MARRGPVRTMLRSAASWAAFMLAGGGGFVDAFLPGLGPDVFEIHDQLPLYVNELTSTRKQAPLDHYHVAYCKPDSLEKRTENLGAYLEGEREESSLYDLRVSENQYCRVLCEKSLTSGDRYMFSNVISDEYLAHMTVDGLPVVYEATRREGGMGQSSTSDVPRQGDPIFMRGFPVGFRDKEDNTYLNNHLRLTIAINARDLEHTKFHIVGFVVEPFSVQHQFQSPHDLKVAPSTCSKTGYNRADPNFYLRTDYEGNVLFTYDVLWEETEMSWTQKWDIYSNGATDNQIHWFSITNSSVIVMFLTVLVAMIMIRALRKDIQRYNAEDMEEASEESGWKLVHGDVMRPPTTYPMLFAVCVGTGSQLWTVSFLVLFFSMARLVSPLHRGSMLTVSILIYVLTGSIAGYTAARIHRRFRGTQWMKMTALTAMGFPVILGTIFMILYVQQWAIQSTGAVPVKVLVLLLALHVMVQVPLVFLGSYYGFRKDLPPQVVRTNQIPRMIPQTPWYVDPKVAVPFAGVLPFGALLVELVFVMNGMWEQQVYYIFGFLLSVMIILTITCAEISIVMCYFQLCSEDYRWWWRSLLWSGSCAGWMFVYSVGYYFTVLQMTGWVAASLFFSYTFILTGSFFLLTGAVGYFSCQWFVNVIYATLKVD